jgi:hypothetical protein
MTEQKDKSAEDEGSKSEKSAQRFQAYYSCCIIVPKSMRILSPVLNQKYYDK